MYIANSVLNACFETIQNIEIGQVLSWISVLQLGLGVTSVLQLVLNSIIVLKLDQSLMSNLSDNVLLHKMNHIKMLEFNIQEYQY